MEGAEKLRMALLKQAIGLDVLASTGLASSVADGQKSAAATPAPAASKGDHYACATHEIGWMQMVEMSDKETICMMGAPLTLTCTFPVIDLHHDDRKEPNRIGVSDCILD